MTKGAWTRCTRLVPGGRYSMSPRPSRLSAPFESMIVRESTLVASRKLIRVGTFALINPVMTSTRWPLRRKDKVNADSARHLSETCDGLFDVGAIEHHQIGQLVDDDDDVWQRLLVDVLEEYSLP